MQQMTPEVKKRCEDLAHASAELALELTETEDSASALRDSVLNLVATGHVPHRLGTDLSLPEVADRALAYIIASRAGLDRLRAEFEALVAADKDEPAA